MEKENYINNEEQEKIIMMINNFSELMNIPDDIKNRELSQILELDKKTAIDRILIILNNCYRNNMIDYQTILENINPLLEIDDSYQTQEDLLDRLHYLMGMNLDSARTSLSVNHQLIKEAFTKFNDIIKTDFDCYYTGGMMGYIMTEQDLVRYHSDLDLLINEEELGFLVDLIKESDDFYLLDNLEKKSLHGHEFKVIYQDTPISIGLFLFERDKDNSIINKEYYQEGDDIYVDYHYLDRKYTTLSYRDEIRCFSGTTFKAVSLENIYYSKYNSLRPKDREDALVIENYVDLDKVRKLDECQNKNKEELHVKTDASLIREIREKINSKGMKK